MRTLGLLSVFLIFICLGCRSSKNSLQNTDAGRMITNSIDSAQVKSEAEKIVRDTVGQTLNEVDKSLEKQIDTQILGDAQALENRIGQLSLENDSLLVRQALAKGKREVNHYLEQEYGAGVTLDNLDSVGLDSARIAELKEEAINRSNQYLAKELGEEYQIPADSASRQQLLQRSEELIQQELISNESMGQWSDQLATQQKLLEDQKALLAAEKAKLENYQNSKELKKRLTNSARDFMQQHAEELQAVQQEMNDLKKVYSKVSDSQDLTQAVKQNSLEEEKFSHRLVFGGNFNIGKSHPFSVDLAPLIGYRLNKLFTIGVTGIYRAQFQRDRALPSRRGEEVYGFSLFASHLVYRNFFGYVEGENLVTRNEVEGQISKNWDQALLVGIGREISISGKGKVQVMVLYNFLHENDGLFGSPVVFKTGIRIE